MNICIYFRVLHLRQKSYSISDIQGHPEQVRMKVNNLQLPLGRAFGISMERSGCGIILWVTHPTFLEKYTFYGILDNATPFSFHMK